MINSVQTQKFSMLSCKILHKNHGMICHGTLNFHEVSQLCSQFYLIRYRIESFEADCYPIRSVPLSLHYNIKLKKEKEILFFDKV